MTHTGACLESEVKAEGNMTLWVAPSRHTPSPSTPQTTADTHTDTQTQTHTQTHTPLKRVEEPRHSEDRRSLSQSCRITRRWLNVTRRHRTKRWADWFHSFLFLFIRWQKVKVRVYEIMYLQCRQRGKWEFRGSCAEQGGWSQGEKQLTDINMIWDNISKLLVRVCLWYLLMWCGHICYFLHLIGASLRICLAPGARERPAPPGTRPPAFMILSL